MGATIHRLVDAVEHGWKECQQLLMRREFEESAACSYIT